MTNTKPHETSEARPFRVGDRVILAGGNGEPTVARVITEPEQMYADDSGPRVRVEIQEASTLTRTPLVAHVRHAEHDDEIHIFTREWIVTGENILDDPDEYADVLFVRNDDVTHIIRTWLAANGYADFRALADVVAENEKLRARRQAEVDDLKAKCGQQADMLAHHCQRRDEALALLDAHDREDADSLHAETLRDSMRKILGGAR